MPEYRPRIHGERNSTHVINKRREYIKTHPPVRLDNPSQEEMRECIKDGYCWWCGRGGWKSLSLHTRSHGIFAKDIRELAGLYKHIPTCLPELSYKMSLLPCNKLNLIKAQNAPKNKHKVMSEAGRKSAIMRLKRFITPEMRHKASLIAAEKHRKPHQCPICGVIIQTSYPITCSPKCRKIIRQRTAIKTASNRILKIPYGEYYNIVNLIKSGCTQKDISIKYKVSRQMIGYIYKRYLEGLSPSKCV
jgi:predicted nucleic acid-binding Zn ribbon protein